MWNPTATPNSASWTGLSEEGGGKDQPAALAGDSCGAAPQQLMPRLEASIAGSVASLISHGGSSSGFNYGALAVAANTLDDKLAVIEHKRRCAGSCNAPPAAPR